MEENNSKGIKKKILISLLCGMLIGCGATTGFFKYQQSKNPGQGGQPPRGEISENMIPEGMTKEEFEAEMKNKKETADDSSNSSDSQNSTDSTTDDSTENESAE